MYDNKTKNSINWRPYFIKGGIVLSIAILFFIIISLFSNTSKVITFNNEDYRSHLNTMKESGFEYFTSNQLPENIGESTTITLEQMINQKLIIDFTDNGEICSLTESYIKATKTNDSNYALKIQLECGDIKDYIVTAIEEIDCSVDCEVQQNESNTTDNNLSSNNSNSSDNNSSGTTSNGSTNTDSNVSVNVTNKVYNFTTILPCTNCDDNNDSKTTYYHYKRNVNKYTYTACEYEHKSYYTTSYVDSSSSSKSYTYTLSLNDLSNVNLNSVKVQSSYFGTDLTDYNAYISSRDQYISMDGLTTNSYNVYMQNASDFRNSSLKNSNFTYSVGNVYLSSNSYKVDVKINYYNGLNVTSYYGNNINKYVYFAPVKFVLSYANTSTCIDKNTYESTYNTYVNNSNYYVYNVKTTTDIEYISSTTKLNSSDGWELIYTETK